MFDVNIIFKKNRYTIIIFFGFFVLLLLSFLDISYNEKVSFSLKNDPNVYFLVFAVIFFILFIFRYFFHNIFYNNNERRKYSYVIDIDENHKVIIKQGDISLYDGDTDKALLLPANTSFDEKCITDKNSALGSYFLKNFPDRIEKTKKIIIETAVEKFSLTKEKRCSDIGDTILLPKYNGEKTNILISAVTQDSPSVGIQANAIGIISSVKNAISLCSKNRYISLSMPIIGTGHGGMKSSISLILICVQYFLSVYYSQNHHVKELVIIVFDPDKRLKIEIDEAVECIRKIISKKNKK